MRDGKVWDEPVVLVGLEAIAARPGCQVLDIGACFGQMVVLFSKVAGSVLALEAEPFVYSVCKKNLQINNCYNASVENLAAWDSTGKQLVFPEPDFSHFGSWGSFGVAPKAESGRTVTSVKIDDLVGDRAVGFIKIDTQGSDLAVLRGAESTLRADKPVVVFEYEEQFQAEFGTSLEQYMEFLASVDYRVREVLDDINYVCVAKGE